MDQISSYSIPFRYIPPVSFRAVPLSALALALLGCGSSALRIAGAPRGDTYVQGFDGSERSVAIGKIRLRPEVCKGFPLAQEHRKLGANDFVKFLESRGFDPKVTRARPDLVFVDISNAGTHDPVRFRVATLDNAGAAGRDLHVSLLQHGEGRWGFHRSNLAVLAPPASASDIVAFASLTKLACWGVLTVAGLDDSYVIPGGYSEL